VKPLERGGVARGEARLDVLETVHLLDPEQLAKAERHGLHAFLVPAAVFERNGARKGLQPVVLARQPALFAAHGHEKIRQPFEKRQLLLRRGRGFGMWINPGHSSMLKRFPRSDKGSVCNGTKIFAKGLVAVVLRLEG